jgi:hypothetical protein
LPGKTALVAIFPRIPERYPPFPIISADNSKKFSDILGNLEKYLRKNA